jgi:hypothetical protein
MGLGSGIRNKPIPDPGINLFRIPDPGVKKAPDPGSGSVTLEKPMHNADPGCLSWIRSFPSRIQGQRGNGYRIIIHSKYIKADNGY